MPRFAPKLGLQVSSDLGAGLPGNSRQLGLQLTAIQLDELWRRPRRALWLLRQTSSVTGRIGGPIAYHPESHRVIGCKIGNREVKSFGESGLCIWRKNFGFATDCLQAHKNIIPDLNGRIRSRCSRLVKKPIMLKNEKIMNRPLRSSFISQIWHMKECNSM